VRQGRGAALGTALVSLGATLGAASCTERSRVSAPAPLTLAVAGSTGEAGLLVHLERIAPGGDVVSFGVPLAPHTLSSAKSVRVRIHGAPVPAIVRPLLADVGADADASRVPRGVRAIVIQIPSRAIGPGAADVTLAWDPPFESAPSPEPTPYRSDAISFESSQVVTTAVRTIVPTTEGAALVPGPSTRRTLFPSREPRVLATFPRGYLAGSRILGRQVTAAELASTQSGLRYLSTQFVGFAGAALYESSSPLADDPDAVPDLRASYEAWLYDRCATFLLAYVHTDDPRFLRTGLRTCANYAAQIELSGPNRGTFRGKPDPDPKYSHLRGLYAYYALTGDEVAREAGRAIAEMWLNDRLFVAPYRAGHVRGPDKLWTERLLGTSLEAMIYGYLLTSEPKYLQAFRELLATAYRHISGDAAVLAQINPGFSFPPQNCFVHSAAQQAEGDAKDPWCSGWMIDLLVDPLLRYQELANDPRVDEIFVRLTRFLRDVGTTYFHKDPLKDHFLSPSVCDDPADRDDRRQLVPSYGSGVAPDGTPRTFGEFEDYLHCPDATAITAAGIRALKRQGKFDVRPIGPFPTEGASFLQLHHELSFCAERALAGEYRPMRDPSRWSASALVPGLADPAKFIRDQKIGWPVYALTPQRRLSWWFNTSMEQFSLLAEAGVEIRQILPGAVRGPACGR
jgi:hypothetical protein